MSGRNGDASLLDLRSGRSLWDIVSGEGPPFGRLAGHVSTEVVVVGAGITGAFIAEMLTRQGREVLVLDRHAPGRASTSASTALLQWEIDAPLIELEDRLGFGTAARIYQRSAAAVAAIGERVAELRLDCGFAPRDTLYLAGDALDAAELAEEARIRERAGLPSRLLDRHALGAGHGLSRDAAILSRGSAEADPVRLAHGLLAAALARTGAGRLRLAAPCLVTGYDADVRGVTLETEEGPIVTAEALVLANGYEMPPFIPSDVHRIVSTYALATIPQAPQALWPGRSLVWEASDPYHYLRTDQENRIIMGGGDEPIADEAARDALLPRKVAALREALAALVPGATTEVETAWTGFFSETEDGLPMIGRVPGMPRCFAAFGYGGNGITFSALAAQILAKLMRGERDDDEESFAIDR